MSTTEFPEQLLRQAGARRTELLALGAAFNAMTAAEQAEFAADLRTMTGRERRDTLEAWRRGDDADLDALQDVDAPPDRHASERPAPDVDPPKGNASREEWAAYALTRPGVTEEALADLGRDEIRDTYGPKDDETT
jgi:hypothetical protein